MIPHNLRCLKDVVTFFEQKIGARDLLTELFKITKILLTIPINACTNERSFSDLRRLKTYMRSTMLQQRLNDFVILHVYCNFIKNINIDEILNLLRKTKFEGTRLLLSNYKFFVVILVIFPKIVPMLIFVILLCSP